MNNQLPIHQAVEYRSAQELWNNLSALPKQYNCNYPIPKSEELKEFFELFNLMSDDDVSEKDIIRSVNSIPQFKVKALCQTVLNEIRKLRVPENDAEQQCQFREVSRIALREGILPSALYVHMMMYMNENKVE